MRVGGEVDFGGERVLSEVGRKKGERGVSGVSAGRLEKLEDIVEGASGGQGRKKRVKDRGGLRDRGDESGGTVFRC